MWHGPDAEAGEACARSPHSAEPAGQVHASAGECFHADILTGRFAESVTASGTGCPPAALPACSGAALRPPHLTKARFPSRIVPASREARTRNEAFYQ